MPSSQYTPAHHRWEGYYAAAGVDIDIHQLRHAHATELEVTPASPSRPSAAGLGHTSSETTQLYAMLDAEVADAEVRR